MRYSTEKSPNKLHPSTKTIKKATLKQTSPNSKSQKKYIIINKETKEKIMESIMEALGTETFEKDDLLERYKKAELSILNGILIKVLKKYTQCQDSFDTEDLKQWRRKVNGWIQNANRPETRGGVVVTKDKIPEFKTELVQLLNNTPSRSFTSLRPHVLKILERMHNKSAKKGKAFNKKTCSKHFWYDFLKKNPDIKALYEKATNAVNASNGQDDYETTDYSVTTHENDEVFSPQVAIAYEGGVFEISTPNFMEEEEEEERKENYDFFVQPGARIIEAEEVEYILSSNQKAYDCFPSFERRVAECEYPQSLNYREEEYDFSQAKSVLNETAQAQYTQMPNDISLTYMEEEKSEGYDFYKSEKRIVEFEDNQYQRKFFGELYDNKECL